MMKRIMIVLALQLCCATGLFAWQDYDQFYREHKGETGVLSFSVPVSLLQVFMEDDEDLNDIFSKIDRVSFFVADENSQELIRDLNNELSDGNYKDMVEMKDGISIFRLVGKDDGEGLEEIIVSVEDKDSLVVICVKGLFSYDDARELARSLNTDRVREQVK